MYLKICKKCNNIKQLQEFHKHCGNKDGHQSTCIDCAEKYRQEHLADFLKREKIRREKVRQISKNIPNSKRCATCKLEKDSSEFGKCSYRKSGLRWNCKSCERVLRAKDKSKTNNRRKNRYKNDIEFKLRSKFSSVVSTKLKEFGGSKNGKSISKYLSYTISELKNHLESKFEPWMNWDNYGIYCSDKRTWQIDHIVPQSLLPYDSMEHPNFQKCWALENLQPMEALQNIRKNNKIS